jgi:hypothetical protein
MKWKVMMLVLAILASLLLLPGVMGQKEVTIAIPANDSAEVTLGNYSSGDYLNISLESSSAPIRLSICEKYFCCNKWQTRILFDVSDVTQGDWSIEITEDQEYYLRIVNNNDQEVSVDYALEEKGGVEDPPADVDLVLLVLIVFPVLVIVSIVVVIVVIIKMVLKRSKLEEGVEEPEWYRPQPQGYVYWDEDYYPYREAPPRNW